jgi:hypothetical protein
MRGLSQQVLYWELETCVQRTRTSLLWIGWEAQGHPGTSVAVVVLVVVVVVVVFFPHLSVQ